MVMSVSGATSLEDGSWLQTLNLFWGGGKATPDIPGAAATPQHPQSWGNFSTCSNINGRVPKDWTPLAPQGSIAVFRAVSPFRSWSLHGVIANASDYPCSTEGPSEHDIVRLADGRLMAVFRTDGGDGHGWQPYSQSFSEDQGTPHRHRGALCCPLPTVSATIHADRADVVPREDDGQRPGRRQRHCPPSLAAAAVRPNPAGWRPLHEGPVAMDQLLGRAHCLGPGALDQPRRRRGQVGDAQPELLAQPPHPQRIAALYRLCEQHFALVRSDLRAKLQDHPVPRAPSPTPRYSNTRTVLYARSDWADV